MSDEARRRRARKAATDGPHGVQRALGEPILPSVWSDEHTAYLATLRALGTPGNLIWWTAIGRYLQGRLKTVRTRKMKIKQVDLPAGWRVTYL